MRIDEKLMKKYKEYLLLHLKKTTYDENVLKFDKYIFSFFKGKKIKKLKLNDIIFWKEYINKYNFKYNYKANLYYILCSFFDYLLKYYDIEKNYARIEGNFKNEEQDTIGNFWTIEEFNQFINNVDDIKYNILFKILFFSGMRRGELLALTWNDIDFKNYTININKSISKKHEIFNPKTKSSNRIITLNYSIINELEKYKKEDNDIIFDIPFTTLKRKKDYYCKKAKVKQIRIHEFRHSHSIYLYLNNIPLDEIQQRLGHSSMSTTTDTYLKYLPRNEKRVIKLLNSAC